MTVQMYTTSSHFMLVGLALRELQEEGNNFFLSVETTGTYVKTLFVDMSQI